jgi:hypothetical protein
MSSYSNSQDLNHFMSNTPAYYAEYRLQNYSIQVQIQIQAQIQIQTKILSIA